MNYVPLYIKTENSLLSSLIKIDELIKFAKSYNYKALSIVDNNMFGVMEFYKKCFRILAKNFHPDNLDGSMEDMKNLNQLKAMWGI